MASSQHHKPKLSIKLKEAKETDPDGLPQKPSEGLPYASIVKGSYNPFHDPKFGLILILSRSLFHLAMGYGLESLNLD